MWGVGGARTFLACFFACIFGGFTAADAVRFCDEKAQTGNPFKSLSGHIAASVSLIIGPEGGFDDHERQLILSYPNVVCLSLGPRILRADTAAVAALTIVQAALGDWGNAS